MYWYSVYVYCILAVITIYIVHMTVWLYVHVYRTVACYDRRSAGEVHLS